MFILKHYFKPENKTDNSDFTKFGIKSALYQIYKNYPIVGVFKKFNINFAFGKKSKL